MDKTELNNLKGESKNTLTFLRFGKTKNQLTKERLEIENLKWELAKKYWWALTILFGLGMAVGKFFL